jgi:CheY-like chemotaxis protein
MARILVIDDDEILRRLLGRVLTRAGHTVSAAADGLEATRLAHEQPFDLVITDLLMPESDGLEVIMAIREEFPGLRVIAISGGGRLGSNGYLRMARNLGASAVLSKPFENAELLSLVDKLLSGGDSVDNPDI